MAVNHADGTMLVSVIFFPIAAGMGAGHAGGGGWIALFIPAGLVVGVGIIYVGRKLVYGVAQFGLSRTSRISPGWLQQLACAPFFVLYMILPLAIVWGGVFATWAGSIWLVKHLW